MEPKICLALGGGAARGLAHLGVLEVFEDAKITVHMIAGTSLGAMIGGLYASHPDAVYWMDRSEQFIRSFHSRKTRLEFLRKLEQPNNNERGFFGDMAQIIRKGFFWGVTATKSAFIGEKEYQDFIYPLSPILLSIRPRSLSAALPRTYGTANGLCIQQGRSALRSVRVVLCPAFSHR